MPQQPEYAYWILWMHLKNFHAAIVTKFHSVSQSQHKAATMSYPTFALPCRAPWHLSDCDPIASMLSVSDSRRRLPIACIRSKILYSKINIFKSFSGSQDETWGSSKVQPQITKLTKIEEKWRHEQLYPEAAWDAEDTCCQCPVCSSAWVICSCCQARRTEIGRD